MKKTWMIILLFTLGLCIFIYPHAAQYVNNQKQSLEVQEFQQRNASIPEKEKELTIEKIKECNESIFNNSEVLQDPFSDDYDMGLYEECIEAPEDGSLVSSLEIPSMDLNIPIYLGSGEDSLSRGVGQVEGSSLPVGGLSTHTVLAGHRGAWTKEMFRHVDVLQAGDIFYIHTLSETIKYTIYDKKVVLPHETDSLQIIENKDLATLLTCHPYPSNHNRLLIYAERTDESFDQTGGK